MKAECFTKWPWSSRKCSGWKRKGIFQTVSSFSTDDRLVKSVVPWQEMPDMGGVWAGDAESPATKHTWAHPLCLVITRPDTLPLPHSVARLSLSSPKQALNGQGRVCLCSAPHTLPGWDRQCLWK